MLQIFKLELKNRLAWMICPLDVIELVIDKLIFR